MIVALLGVGVMVGSPGGGSALGSGLAVVMALGFAVGIVIARHRRDVSMAPATGRLAEPGAAEAEHPPI
ncbi:MAG TPA: hypothetical protein VFN87_06305 [Solirubrobacteraceae bacterium]|nr:hypothetical protein [Solirubrobacteraceae bacterium]